MPVQINEMVIRANIVEPGTKPTEGKATASTELDREDMIRECVAIVMEMIHQKNAR
jgi:hypothetical protein